MMGVAATTGLTAEQVERFHTEGYLVVEGVLDAERDIEPVLGEYAEVLDGIARQLYDVGEIGSSLRQTWTSTSARRGLRGERAQFPAALRLQPAAAGVRRDTPIHVGPAVFGHAGQPAPARPGRGHADRARRPYSNPVQHIRIKLPPRAVASKATTAG